ncbi:glutaredoxin domain-containing protein [Pseudalkalibacillus caeni]|uniref:NrdH-redoxin n=1 Tax=Exobacillus caeni TaxID=2574798 RepID=A0A5R9FAF0_9BACL|nr:glutaredoxin domain-containing protein [Pseudalkalibacillus caeni]TLS37534.1 NrdH-redoxin [Pseudalkalibacillus caeni]
MTDKKVIVYTQPSCPPCQIVKEFLTHHNVNFTSYNVKEDKNALNEMVKNYNSMSTPTIVIGEEVVTGFNQEQLEKLLNL